MRYTFLLAAFAGIVCAVQGAQAQAIVVPNGSFESGQNKQPADWTLIGGEGAWMADAGDGKHAVSVTGTGAPGSSGTWRSPALDLQPFTTYRLRFEARQIAGGGGCATTGPAFCNRDLGGVPAMWTPYTSYFVSPTKITQDSAWLRFGQWEMNGAIAYSGIEIMATQPVYAQRGPLTLGDGEQVTGTAPIVSARRSIRPTPISRVLGPRSTRCTTRSAGFSARTAW